MTTGRSPASGIFSHWSKARGGRVCREGAIENRRGAVEQLVPGLRPRRRPVGRDRKGCVGRSAPGVDLRSDRLAGISGQGNRNRNSDEAAAEMRRSRHPDGHIVRGEGQGRLLQAIRLPRTAAGRARDEMGEPGYRQEPASCSPCRTSRWNTEWAQVSTKLIWSMISAGLRTP